MSRNISRWQPGQSGNPRGRPPQGRALSQKIKDAMEEIMTIGSDESTAQDLVAHMMRDFLVFGEVWVNGRKLQAETVMEWLAAVRWVYEQIDGKAPILDNGDHELIVQVIYDDQG